MSRVERIGDATLYLGDARDVLPTLAGIDAVVTSPPYNQMSGLLREPSGSWAKSDFGLQFVRNWQQSGYDDDMPEPAYQADQIAILEACAVACSSSASLFYNHQIRWRDGVCIHPIAWVTPDRWNLRQEIIWDRCGGMMFNARMFVRFDERVLWFTRAGGNWTWNQEAVGDGTIWRIAREQNKEHPVAFPVGLPWRCIRAATNPDDLVLDPFAGSGTTGVAAAMLGRRFVGIERSPEYFDLMCRRISEAQRQGDLLRSSKPPKAEQIDMLAGMV